ncbi:MAG: phospholipase D-like domain-containing protein [Vicinamibacterales bacterium]
MLCSPESGAANVQTLCYLATPAPRRSILIANPYFVPDEVGIDLLVAAAGRGVLVRVMVSGRRSDNWLARQNSIRLYGPLLHAGIEILEYNRSMMHHKVMVVDGQWVTIGTANFDRRSFSHNEESNLSLFGAGDAQAFTARFEQDVSACAPVMLEQWRRRGLRTRLEGALAALFVDQV